ncbi:MAG: nickel-dependent hydrogenase large subunit [Anaerolineae bacterium]
MAAAHYLAALDFQRNFIRAHAVLGAKNPHLQTYLVGGMASPIDPDSQSAINADKLALIGSLLGEAKKFVTQVYLPDVLAVAPFYLEWTKVGEGTGNFMSYGDYPMPPGKPDACRYHPQPRPVAGLPQTRRRLPSTSPTRSTPMPTRRSASTPGMATRSRITPA